MPTAHLQPVYAAALAASGDQAVAEQVSELPQVLVSFYALGVRRGGWLVHRALPGDADNERALLTAAGMSRDRPVGTICAFIVGDHATPAGLPGPHRHPRAGRRRLRSLALTVRLEAPVEHEGRAGGS